MAEQHKLGEKGEDLAVDYLQKKGYRVLERNFRFRKAEVDIIAQKENLLVAVEVKTRSTDYFGNPQDFVKRKKRMLLIQAMHQFVIEKNVDLDLRFDIIAILRRKHGFEIEHLKDAFFPF